jgi:hypothetical protein
MQDLQLLSQQSGAGQAPVPDYVGAIGDIQQTSRQPTPYPTQRPISQPSTRPTYPTTRPSGTSGGVADILVAPRGATSPHRSSPSYVPSPGGGTSMVPTLTPLRGI